jgi:hypothetical protein
MKTQKFNCIKKEVTLQIVGGITDPNLDPDAVYVTPVADPIPVDGPGDTIPVDTAEPRRPR